MYTELNCRVIFQSTAESAKRCSLRGYDVHILRQFTAHLPLLVLKDLESKDTFKKSGAQKSINR